MLFSFWGQQTVPSKQDTPTFIPGSCAQVAPERPFGAPLFARGPIGGSWVANVGGFQLLGALSEDVVWGVL